MLANPQSIETYKQQNERNAIDRIANTRSPTMAFLKKVKTSQQLISQTTKIGAQACIMKKNNREGVFTGRERRIL